MVVLTPSAPPASFFPCTMSRIYACILQRQVVDKRVWRELTAFFPGAVPFRVESPECLECRGESANERKAEEAVRREREQEIALPVLKALYGRKTGVSEACDCCAKAVFGDCQLLSLGASRHVSHPVALDGDVRGLVFLRIELFVDCWPFALCRLQ